MPAVALPGQASWLQFLSTLPDPGSACAALIHGPLRHYGARAGGFWSLTADALERVTTYGHTAAETSRSGRIPLRLDFAITRAVKTDSFQYAAVERNATDHRAAEYDVTQWQAVATRLDAATIGNAPIRYGGRVVGAFGFICNQQVAWTAADGQALLGLGSALGLWLTHPLRDAAPPAVVYSDERPLALTGRQEQILLLVEDGIPTAQIAHLLRYSVSTVKSDLGQAMRALRATDRATAASRARRLGLLDDVPPERTGMGADAVREEADAVR